MFDLVFSTLTALNQVATFVGALVFWGLGGLLVGNAIYWRRQAVRVQGEVIGVRRNGNCLNSVYRYVSPSGETFEATSLEGSSSVRGKETGTTVPLWVIPEKPNEVQEAANHVFTVVGVLLLGAGVALFWVGVTAWRTGPMTWVVASLAVVHLLQKVRGIIAPKDKALPRWPWRELLAQMRDAGAQARNAQPVQRLEELTRLPEYRDKEIRQRAAQARGAVSGGGRHRVAGARRAPEPAASAPSIHRSPSAGYRHVPPLLERQPRRGYLPSDRGLHRRPRPEAGLQGLRRDESADVSRGPGGHRALRA